MTKILNKTFKKYCSFLFVGIVIIMIEFLLYYFFDIKCAFFLKYKGHFFDKVAFISFLIFFVISALFCSLIIILYEELPLFRKALKFIGYGCITIIIILFIFYVIFF